MVLVRAACGCVRIAAPEVSAARQRQLRREAVQRGYTYELRRGDIGYLNRILRETWTCGEAGCRFQAEVRAEEGRR